MLAHGINQLLESVVLLAVPNMAAFFTAFNWHYGTPTPSAVSVSDRGLHLWFEEPIDCYLLEDVLTWKAFGEYEKMQKRFWTRQRGPFDAVTYFSSNLRLPKSNADDLRMAWEIRRPNWLPPSELIPTRATLR